MTGHAIPVLVMSTVAACMASYHLLIYARRPDQRQDLAFAVACLLVAIYNGLCVGLYNMTSPEEAVRWQHWQVAVFPLLGIAGLWFAIEYTQAGFSRFTRVFMGWLLFAASVSALWRGPLTWTTTPAVKYVTLPFVDGPITIYEMTAGPFSILVSLSGVLCFVYIFWIGARAYRGGQRRETLPLLLAMGVFFGAMVNDAAINAGLYAFLYVAEYGFIGVIVLMAFALSSELVEAAKTRQALVESEQNYQAVYNATNEAILVHDGATGAILDVNDGMTQMFGYSREEVRDLGVEDVSSGKSPYTQTEAVEWIGRAVREGPQLFEWMSKRKDGTLFWSEVSLSRYYLEPGENRVLAVVRDVSERKRAVEELRASEERFRSLIESAGSVVLRLSPEGKILEFNPEAELVFGLKRADVLDKDCLEMCLPEHEREAVAADISKVLAGEPTRGFENLVKSAAGNEHLLIWNVDRLLDDAGAPIGLICVGQDITARRQAEKALRRSEEQFSKAFQTSPNPMLITRMRDGLILEVNDSFVKDFGPTREDIEGRTTTDLNLFQEPGDRDAIVRLLRTEEGFRSLEVTLRSKFRGLRTFLLSESLLDIDGDRCIFAVAEDITERKEAQEDLRAREQTIRALVETSQDWIWSINLQGIHTYSNAAIEGILGYRVDEIVGKPSFRLMHEDDRREIEAKLPEWVAEKRGWQNALIRWRHKDGSWRYLESSAVPMLDADGELVGFQGVDRDTTERRHSEEALREEEQRYRALFESAHDAIFLVEGDRFVDCNPKTLEMFGCTREQIIGKEPYVFSPEHQPDGRASEEKALEKINAALSGRPQVFEWLHSRYDGTLFDAEVSLNRLEISGRTLLLAFVRDTSERKQMQEERMRLATAIECAGEAIVLVDLDGQIGYVNPAFEQATGYSRDDAIGQNIRMLESEEQGGPSHEDAWKAMKHAETWNGRMTTKRKDGTVYEASVTVSPVRDASETTTGYICVRRDISDQLALEARVRQAQKMEAMGALAGGIAHDFNNILSAILGYTDLAMSDAGEDSNVNKSLAEVAKAGHRAADLVAQILAFSRQAERERKPLRLHTVAKEVLKLLRGSIPPTIDIRQDIDTSCDAVMADPTEIHQILMNLCTNAYHAMRETGGVLDVGLAQVDVGEDEANQDPRLKPGRHVRLTVCDNGHGIDEATQARIFEPYFTTKTRGEGTGLGLATVHGIVTEMGGTIHVYSELEKGTTFGILLPTIGTEDGSLDKRLPDTETLAGSERILVVDDEEPIANLAKAVLGRLGYDVTIRTDSREALELFREDPDKFDVVITDQMMPGMRGTELSEQLLAVRPGIPIILCSGFGDVLKNVKDEDSGIRGYVMKPIIAADLAKAIRSVIEKGETPEA